MLKNIMVSLALFNFGCNQLMKVDLNVPNLEVVDRVVDEEIKEQPDRYEGLITDVVVASEA